MLSAVWHDPPSARLKHLPVIGHASGGTPELVRDGITGFLYTDGAEALAARMLEQGHAPLYWENIEGGHGGAADNAQRARMLALELGFLWHELAPASAAA